MYLGIDPGAGGAICALRFTPTGITKILFHDLPNPRMPHREVYDFLVQLKNNSAKEMIYVAVEDVHSLPNMTAKSNFGFGYNLSTVHTLLYSAGLSFTKIQPKAWQKRVGVVFPKGTDPKGRKALTAKRCLELYPKAAIYGPQGGLKDGRADALMIAHALYLEKQP